MENIAAFLVGAFAMLFIWILTWMFNQWKDNNGNNNF